METLIVLVGYGLTSFLSGMAVQAVIEWHMVTKIAIQHQERIERLVKQEWALIDIERTR